jgi:ABC-type phosphate transport system substrate-binding protein
MTRSGSLLFIAGLALATPALAADLGPCASQPNRIYVTGSTAIQPFIAKLSGPMKTAGYTIVYQSQGSCTGVDAIVSGTKVTGTGTVFQADAVNKDTCTFDAAGESVDVGVSDVFAKSCKVDQPTTVGDFFGPIAAMNLVVPKASTQTAVTWEQVHMLFGYGADAQVSPWTDNQQIFHRNDKSGTQQMVAYAVDLPADKWKTGADAATGPFDTGGSGALRDKVAAGAATAIGILGADSYDLARERLSALAFKGKDQLFAYFPDSTAASFDKRNVREGRYLIWGPLHMLATIGADGKPTNAAAKKLIDVVMGNDSIAGADIVDIETDAHTVPSCAMSVKRTTELGPLSPYAPAVPCACYFEKRADGATSCATCTGADGTACTGGGVCRRGYCEAR